MPKKKTTKPTEPVIETVEVTPEELAAASAPVEAVDEVPAPDVPADAASSDVEAQAEAVPPVPTDEEVAANDAYVAAAGLLTSDSTDEDGDPVPDVAAEDPDAPDEVEQVELFKPRESRFKRTDPDPANTSGVQMVGVPPKPVIAPPNVIKRKTDFLPRDLGMPQDPNGLMREVRKTFEAAWRKARTSEKKRKLFNDTMVALGRWVQEFEKHRETHGSVAQLQNDARINRMKRFHDKQAIKEAALAKARVKRDKEIADLELRVNQVLMEAGTEDDPDEVSDEQRARIENMFLDTGTVEKSVVSGQSNGGSEGANDA